MWFATQGMEITLEVHEDKEGTDKYAERLPWLYLEMRDPLLNFVGYVHHSFQVSIPNRPGQQLRVCRCRSRTQQRLGGERERRCVCGGGGGRYTSVCR